MHLQGDSRFLFTSLKLINMNIQFNTDHNVPGSKPVRDYFVSVITEGLSQHSAHISRLEVHLADENADKSGPEDKKCTIEARIEGRQPVAVIAHGDTKEAAIDTAIVKLNNMLNTIMDKQNSHRG